jgi:hypothetical protein
LNEEEDYEGEEEKNEEDIHDVEGNNDDKVVDC